MSLTTELLELPPAFTKSRMHSLYSDFRKLEESNPEGFTANISAWSAALISALATRDFFPDATTISAGPNLISLFEHSQHGTPLALDTVFDELVKQGSLIPLQQFLNPSRMSIYYQKSWYSSLVPTPKSVFSWALTKSGIYDSSWHSAENKLQGSLKKERYVSVSCLEAISVALLTILQSELTTTNTNTINSSSLLTSNNTLTTSETDNPNTISSIGTPGGYTRTVFTKDMFYSKYSKVLIPPRTLPYNKSSNKPCIVDLSTTDLDVLIAYLSKDKPRFSVKDDTIKINLSATNEGDIEPVTEKDRAVANMRSSIEQIVHKVNTLGSHIEACNKKARQALSSSTTITTTSSSSITTTAGNINKNKAIAKYALRSRHMAQQSQETALGMLTNLETTLNSIDSATSNIEVMTALQSGVGILTNLNKTIGGAEKVAQLMDELNDATLDTEDIGKQIGELSKASDVDEDEVEDELQQMLLEEQKQQKQQQQSEKEKEKENQTQQILQSMPKVPDSDIKSLSKNNNTQKETDIEDDLASQLEKINI